MKTKKPAGVRVDTNNVFEDSGVIVTNHGPNPVYVQLEQFRRSEHQVAQDTGRYIARVTADHLTPNTKLGIVVREHLKTCPGSDDSSGRMERLRFLVTALAGEAGEMLNLVKKEWRGDFKDEDKMPEWHWKLVGELIDVANYTDMLCDHLGIDKQGFQMQKFRDVEERKTYTGRKIAADLVPEKTAWRLHPKEPPAGKLWLDQQEPGARIDSRFGTGRLKGRPI